MYDEPKRIRVEKNEHSENCQHCQMSQASISSAHTRKRLYRSQEEDSTVYSARRTDGT